VVNSQKSPTLKPPEAGTTSDVDAPGTSEPTAISDERIAALVESTPLTGPTVRPPTVAVEAAEGVTATWRNNVRIDALWSIDETRNAWVRVVDVGWRKIYNGRDGAFQALTTIASQARQTGRPVNLREEPDGMIYEIYLW
jgi:glucose/arabinose dehydrogenase